MASQYAFKAVSASWLDPTAFGGYAGGQVASSTETTAYPAQTPAVMTVGADIPAYAEARPPAWVATVRFRDPATASDAANAVIAFDEPAFPWKQLHGRGEQGPNGHLIRLTYDDVTDLVANCSLQFDADQTANTLLLRACHVDAEMIYNGSGFVVI